MTDRLAHLETKGSDDWLAGYWAAITELTAWMAKFETIAIWANAVAVVEALREPLPSGDYARGRSHMHAEILAALRDQARHG